MIFQSILGAMAMRQMQGRVSPTQVRLPTFLFEALRSEMIQFARYPDNSPNSVVNPYTTSFYAAGIYFQDATDGT